MGAPSLSGEVHEGMPASWPAEGKAPVFLVPMDGSPEAASALAVALRLAAPSGGEVAALHVSKPGLIMRRAPLAPSPLSEFAHHGEDDAEEARLAMLPAPVWAKAAGVRVALYGARGKPAPAILACAEAIGATMVVMGAHGRSGKSEGKTLGSVAHEVYGASKRPTVVVPPKGVRDSETLARAFASPPEGAAPGSKVICALDGGPGSDEVVAASVELARRTRGSLRLFSGAPAYPGADTAAAVANAQQAALAALVQFKVDTGATDALRGLVELSEGERDAVIVVGARAAAGRAPGEVGSFTAKLLGASQCAIAVLPVGSAAP